MTKAAILDKIEEIYEGGSSRLSDLYTGSRLSDIDALNKVLGKKKEEKKTSATVWIFAILGVIIFVAVIAYFAYKYFEPDYLEDFEDDFDEDFEDDFFDEDESAADEVQ